MLWRGKMWGQYASVFFGGNCVFKRNRIQWKRHCTVVLFGDVKNHDEGVQRSLSQKREHSIPFPPLGKKCKKCKSAKNRECLRCLQCMFMSANFRQLFACKFSIVKKIASHNLLFLSCFQGSQPKPNQKSPGRNFPDAPKSGTSVSGPFIFGAKSISGLINLVFVH